MSSLSKRCRMSLNVLAASWFCSRHSKRSVGIGSAKDALKKSLDRKLSS